MSIWAIADLHLSFGVENKKMDVFGDKWIDHPGKLKKAWCEVIADDDLVLLPGDISWAMHMEQAMPDLEWIDALPGTKVMIRGNHDYWWPSLSRLKKDLPPSIHAIHNNSFDWKDISVCGTRLWDDPTLDFMDIIDFEPNPISKAPGVPEGEDPEAWREQQDKIFMREIHRLELSLKSLNPEAKTRIAMTHYPPIGLDLAESTTSKLLKQYGVDICVFGHLHNVKEGLACFGKSDGISYHFVACDYTHYKPLKVL